MGATVSKAEYDAKERENERLKNENALLRRALFGPRSERRSALEVPEQIALWGEPAAAATESSRDDQAPSEPIARKRTKKHPGRIKLSDALPVEEITREPIEDVTDLVRIGEEVTEILVRQPERLFIRRIIRPKYAKPTPDGTTTIVVAELPECPLPKSYAHASLLAYIFVAKFVDHLPFYRQAIAFERRHGVIIPSSTLSDWYAACCRLLEPLYQALRRSVLETDYVQGDETTIPVLTLNQN